MSYWLTRRNRRLWLMAAVGAVIASAVAAVLLWPRLPAAVPAPRARVYLDVSACLLTDPSGVTAGAPGAAPWRAMQSASLASRVMVSYLAEPRAGETDPMLSSLLQRRCGLIIALDTDAGNVVAAARAHPAQHFVLLAAAAPDPMPPNIAVVAPADLGAGIDRAIRALASRAPPS